MWTDLNRVTEGKPVAVRVYHHVKLICQAIGITFVLGGGVLLLLAVRHWSADSDSPAEFCPARRLESNVGHIDMQRTRANAEAPVFCPYGYQYTGPELECGYVDLVCEEAEPGAGSTSCRRVFGFVPKGTGLLHFPVQLAPRFVAPEQLQEATTGHPGPALDTESSQNPLCMNAKSEWRSWHKNRQDFCCREIGIECQTRLPRPVDRVECTPRPHSNAAFLQIADNVTPRLIRKLQEVKCDDGSENWKALWSAEKRRACCGAKPWICPGNEAVHLIHDRHEQRVQRAKAPVQTRALDDFQRVSTAAIRDMRERESFQSVSASSSSSIASGPESALHSVARENGKASLLIGSLAALGSSLIVGGYCVIASQRRDWDSAGDRRSIPYSRVDLPSGEAWISVADSCSEIE